MLTISRLFSHQSNGPVRGWRQYEGPEVLDWSRNSTSMGNRIAKMLSVAAMLVLSSCFGSAQTAVPKSDPQALALASSAIAALTGGRSIQDVTLLGDVTWNAGNNDTGTVTLRALGSNESRVDLALAAGTRSEIRDASTGAAKGKWDSPDGKSGVFAYQNTMTDAVWFFPAFGSLAGGPNVVLSYVGQESRNDQPVQHLRSIIYHPELSGGAGPSLQRLSTMDFYLDATSLLPVAVLYNQHPDDNVAVNIPIEIDYSNYQSVSGVQVPMHIQKSANGSLTLDVAVTSAAFNSGLSMSLFSVN